MSYRVVVVEDDAMLRENYADAFGAQGYAVTTYPDRPAAQAGMATQLPDLAVVDIGLGTEIDGGFALCQWLRTQSTTLPIIFLSARDDDYDIVSGLRMGADDYVTKDVSLPHLVARVAALFRRTEALTTNTADDEEHLNTDLLTIEPSRMICRWGEQRVNLTLTEFWIVYALARRPGLVKTREQLMQQARIFVDDATVTSHVKRIRAKFKQLDTSFDAIEAVYGMGYRWADAG